jgi:hypothetical protein
MKSFLLLLLFLTGGVWIGARADDFFEVEGVTFHQTANTGDPQATKQVPQLDADNKPVLDKNGRPIIQTIPIPFIATQISVQEQTKTSSTVLKAYFYDETLKLIATDSAPFVAPKSQQSVFIPKDEKQTILFAVPDSVLSQDNWSAVVVFGDAKGVDAQAYSSGNQVADFDFPEKNILEDKNGPPIERKVAMDPLIEHVVLTGNPKQPKITLFMRPPLGVTDASQAKGVLCMSLLAGSLDGVKRQLQGLEAGDDLKGILKFAEDRKLIIICWGSVGMWDPHKSWDDLDPDTAWATDQAFDQVAHAWEQGVKYFVDQYGIPSNGYLLWGISGSAQYACRLALRKPDYFLAVHVHIPSSFDKPTPEGRKVLWCLTTGELESGYRRSLRFYAQCRALGYPMIYKAIMHLGHAGSPIADDIGFKFFDYALSIRDQRLAYDASLNDPLKQFQMAQTDNGQVQVWLESFRKPAYVGDSVNQGIFPYDQQDKVPPGFWVPLPTKAIADAWNK